MGLKNIFKVWMMIPLQRFPPAAFWADLKRRWSICIWLSIPNKGNKWRNPLQINAAMNSDKLERITNQHSSFTANALQFW
ncbi:hypothetical protein V6N13_016594 [Hibiscus sabdariffa]